MLTKIIDFFKWPDGWHRAWAPLMLAFGVIVTFAWMAVLGYGFVALISWAI